MALSDLKLESEKRLVFEEYPYDMLYEKAQEFVNLGEDLNEYKGNKTYSYKGKKVEIKGIPEDFRVFLDGQLVCECVYDNIENLNKVLARELLY